MRDTIKPKHYFERYIEDQSKRIDHFKSITEKTIEEKGEDFKGVKNGYNILLKLDIDKTKALYSIGAPIDEIRELFPEILSYFCKTWDKYSYSDILWVTSLAVMLGVSKEEFAEVFDLVKREKFGDCIVDFLLLGINPEWDQKTEKLRFKRPFAALQNVIEAKSPIESIDALKIYIEKKWYSGNSDAGWYDSHKSDDCIYSGYWSLEAGAIAKILKLDDEALENANYYPYDLVHFTDK
jgi:hypothetical protein